jgi:hypothetical protein
MVEALVDLDLFPPSLQAFCLIWPLSSPTLVKITRYIIVTRENDSKARVRAYRDYKSVRTVR